MRPEESIGHRAKRQRSEVRSRRSEVGGQREEDSEETLEVGGAALRQAQASRLEAKDRSQKTEEAQRGRRTSRSSRSDGFRLGGVHPTTKMITNCLSDQPR